MCHVIFQNKSIKSFKSFHLLTNLTIKSFKSFHLLINLTIKWATYEQANLSSAMSAYSSVLVQF